MEYQVDAIMMTGGKDKDGHWVKLRLKNEDDYLEMVNMPVGTPFNNRWRYFDEDGNPIQKTDGSSNPHAQCSEPSVREGVSRSGVGTPSRPSHSREAGIACREPHFQDFLRTNDMLRADLSPEVAARHAIYLICGVGSRTELFVDSPAGKSWRDLYAQYMQWKDAALRAAGLPDEGQRR